MATWIEAQVIGKRLWTPRLVSLKFDAEIAPFKAGQFLRCGLDIGGERVGRPYSLVNAPDEHPFEIYFNIVANGQLSPRLGALEVGDSLWVYESALGFLVLDEVPQAADLWMFSTGSGIGPFLSILKTPEVWQRFEHVVLVHSVRTAGDFVYRDLINSLLAQHTGQFRFVPVVSREQMAGTVHGRIPVAISDHRLEEVASISISTERSHVMLCGNSGMITDATEQLTGRGMRKHRRTASGHWTTEKYF